MTNEQQMTPEVKSWLNDTADTPYGVAQGVSRVMARVPQTRQRSRWWPLLSLQRTSSPAPSATSGRLQPTPVTTTSSHTATGRSQSILNATKFVIAGAIVALFGGFLLAGVLTLQPEESVPAVGATPSTEPSPPPGPAIDVRQLEWRPLQLDEATFGPGARLVDIAASESMLVIGGSVDGSAAVWASTDGLDWTRVPHDEAVFGGPADQEIKAITPWRNGFVAAGEVNPGSDFDTLRVAAVWVSEDGGAWTRVPHDEKVFGGTGRQQMFDIAATDDRLVIVGFDEEGTDAGGSDDIAVWTSADGFTWAQQTFGGGEMLAVEGTPAGFVGVGHRGVWTSSDGLRWQRTDPGGLRLATISGLVQTSEGLVAVGGSSGDRPAAWTSAHGDSWTPATIESRFTESDWWGPKDVAVADSGLAAVAGPGDTGGSSAVLVSPDGTTWVHGDAPASIADAGLRRIAAFGSHFIGIGGWRTTWTTEEPSIWTTIEAGLRAPDTEKQPGDEPVPAARASASASPAPSPVWTLVTSAAMEVATDDAMWHESRGADIVRIDAATGEQIIIPVPGEHSLLVPTDDAIWALGSDGVHRIDRASLSVTDSIDIAGGPAIIIDDSLWLWSLGSGHPSLVEIDLETRTVRSEYPMDDDSWTGGTNDAWWSASYERWIGATDEAIWLHEGPDEGSSGSGAEAGEFLTRFDLETREITDRISIDEPGESDRGSCCVAVDDAIWLSGARDTGTLLRFDVATREVTDRLAVDWQSSSSGMQPGIVAAGAIWITGPRAVHRIDPVTIEVTAIDVITHRGQAPAYAVGAIWVAGGGTLSRIDVDTLDVSEISVTTTPDCFAGYTPLVADGVALIAAGNGVSCRVDLVTGDITRIR